MSLWDWIFILPTWLNVLIVVSALLYLYGVWPYITSNIPYPGPKPWPFIGNMKELFSKGVEQADTYNIKKYGKITLTWVARQPQLIISDLDMIKEINIKQFPKFVNRLVARNRFALSKIESQQLTMLEDDHWKFVRSTLSPAFSSGRLREMVPILQVCVNNLEDAIRQRSGTGKSYDLKKIFEAYTLDAISTTAFGMESNVLKNPDDPLALLLRKFLDRRASFLVMICLMFPFVGRILQKFDISAMPKESQDALNVIVKDVQDIIKQRKQQEVNRRDLLQLMLDARSEENSDVTLDEEVTPDLSALDNTLKKQRKHLTDTEVLAQSFVFLVAGYATTSSTMSLLAYNLAVNPECQDKLLEEIDERLKKEKPTYENVMQLPYLEMCLAETLRMFPATVRTTRETKEDVVVNGHLIPKGVGVQFSVGYLHHNPAYWPEPEKFKPERFAPEEKAKRSPYVYMPFGLGPRNCVGMRLAQLEAKMAMVAVLQKFRFVRSVDTEVPVKITAFGLAQPENGVWLETQPRDDI